MKFSENSPIKVSVVGATGYLGGETIRLLCNHPCVQLKSLTSNSSEGYPVWKYHPGLRSIVDKSFEAYDFERVSSESDIVFCAVPHGAALNVAAELLGANEDLKVIDLSADYRIRDPAVYESWYNVAHTQKKLLKEAVYGLPELYKDKIRNARMVANPGCYPTSAILGLSPLLKGFEIDPMSIVIDSKSGVSGAGRKLSDQTHYPECNESIKAYAVATHRHIPEIEQELSLRAGHDVNVCFTPHLTPMNRGILTTAYCTLSSKTTSAEVTKVYKSAYASKPFVRLMEKGTWPETRFVRGSNFCDIQVKVDKRTNRAIVVSAIDNMIKGGAGQAIENMNIMCGLDETIGLMTTGVFL